MKIGIMQGRLSEPIDGELQRYPFETWADEFVIARKLGLEYIEWIYGGSYYTHNSLSTPWGLDAISRSVSTTGIRVWAVCADYFVDNPLIRRDDIIERDYGIRLLHYLIAVCSLLKIPILTVPFVDNSKLQIDSDLDEAADVLVGCNVLAENAGVTLCLETNLPPLEYVEFLGRFSRLDHPPMVTYDSGNSANLGYQIREEFDAYWHLIRHVHVKDRKHGGPSVPLGTGDADLTTLFNCLRAWNYKGGVTLQTARGDAGCEMTLAESNLAYVNLLLK